VVERRKAKSPWVDYVWRPIAALPGTPDTPPWTVLETDDEATQFYVGSAELGLYRPDTSHYRDNLASGSPGLWVVLRPTGREPPFEIMTVTANPSEGEAFIAEHHVEHAFTKRKQRRADPDALARRGPLARDGKDGKP
jgi:hypothetical protein